MGQNDHFDEELHFKISDLIDRLALEKGTPAYGIAQQVITSGYDSLTENQRAVYNRHVVPALKRLEEEYEANRIDLSNPQ